MRPFLSKKRAIHDKIIALRDQVKEKTAYLETHDFSQRNKPIFNRQLFLSPQTLIEKLNFEIKLTSTHRKLKTDLFIKNLRLVLIDQEEAYYKFLLKFIVSYTSYEKIIKFLQQIENNKYPIFLKSFEFFFNEGKLFTEQKFTFLCFILKNNKWLTKYFYMPNSVAFNALISRNSYCPLKRYPLNNFKLVGVIDEAKISKKWGFLKLPNDHICKVKENDQLGLEKEKIILIDSKKITVQGKNNKKIIELIKKK